MLIVGGWGGLGWAGFHVAVVSPITGRVEDCAIRPLPEARYYHTINNDTVCGGYSSSTWSSCIKLQPNGGWAQSHTLQEPRLRLIDRVTMITILSRRRHSSFYTTDGIILMGGEDSRSTAELAAKDGSTIVMNNYLDYPT